MAYKTHKITLAPTFRQRRWFAQQCGYARFAYNQALADFKTGLAQDTFQSWQTLNNNFNKIKKGYNWVKAQDQRAALYAIKNLGQGKAAALGIPVLKAPHFYASSKTCSRCRHKKDDLTLSERTYHCSQCDYQIDRDINAAINLKYLAVG